MPEIKYKIPENPPPYIPPKPKLPGSNPGSTPTTTLPPIENNPPENPARPIIEKIVIPPVDEWHVGRDYKDKVIDPVTHLPVDHETKDPTDFTSDPKHTTHTVESGTTDHHIYGTDEKPTTNGASPVEVPNMYPHITNVVLNIATPRTLVQIIQDNYARDTINLQNYYLQKLQLILQKYFQEMLTIMAECNIDDIDKLTQDFDGEYVTVGDPNMRHLRDSVCRSQIMRDQKERFIKKMFNVDNTMLHMNKWHVAEQEREAYYAEEYGDSGTFLDSHANALLRDCRSQYDAAYNQSVYDMYKYLDSSCSALGDVLDMTSKEAQAKGQMLKKGVDIFKNRAVEEQRAEDERHEAELKELQRQRELNKDAKPVSMNGGQVTNGHISLEDSNSRSLGQGGGGSSGGARTPGSSVGGGGTCSSAQVEKAVQAAISIANSGCSYQMGGEGPDVYDCTGFISAAFSQAGWPIDVCHAGAFDNGFLSMGFVSIPYSDGNEDQLQRGDILVNNHHVELYIGGGQFAGAHSTASGVSVCSYFDNDWEEIYRFKG